MVDGGHPEQRTRTALVVAVDEDRRDALSHELAAAGFEPVLAADGKQAERSARVVLPDVLILDQGLPGLALFRLYSTVRGLPGGTDVPIFFIGQTGTDTPTDHYLVTDLSSRSVVDRVRDELGVAPTAAEAPTSAAPEAIVIEPHAAPDLPPAAVSEPEPSPGGAFPPSAVTFEPTSVDEPRPAADDTSVVTPVRSTEPVEPSSEPARADAPLRADAIPDPAAPIAAATVAGGESPPAAAERSTPAVAPPTEPGIQPGPAVSPPDPTVVSAPTVVTTTGPAPADEPRTEVRSPVPASEAASRISRLDVVLLRLGLVLLLLGGAVLLLRPDSSTQPIAPPNLPTATPAATRTASPSPAALAVPGR